MGTTFTCSKDGFTLTAHLPESGQRSLRGRLTFPAPKTGGQATVELGMISRKHKALPMPEPWLCERAAPATRKILKPDPQGHADFVLEIPRWMTPFKGEWLEIVMTVLVQAEGTTIRLVVEGAAPPPATRYELRGLPVQRRSRAPLSPWLFGASLVATLVLVVLGFGLAEDELYKGAFACGIIAFTLSFFAIPRARRWRRLGALSLKAEAVGKGPEARLKVSGRGARVTGEGRVQLLAREFVYSNSSLSKFDPIAAVESQLRPSASGAFEAILPWPTPEQAPPSLCLSRAQT
ncbi:MAG TPA: hypothetical protein VFW62_10490, partial [bacterium]|nr:hypothetical protein [bacterium]